MQYSAEVLLNIFHFLELHQQFELLFGISGENIVKRIEQLYDNEKLFEYVDLMYLDNTYTEKLWIYCLFCENYMQLIKWLIQTGVEFSGTHITIAAALGQLDAVQYMIANNKNYYSDTMDLAAFSGNIEL
jgi:hypothetical protein